MIADLFPLLHRMPTVHKKPEDTTDMRLTCFMNVLFENLLSIRRWRSQNDIGCLFISEKWLSKRCKYAHFILTQILMSLLCRESTGVTQISILTFERAPTRDINPSTFRSPDVASISSTCCASRSWVKYDAEFRSIFSPRSVPDHTCVEMQPRLNGSDSRVKRETNADLF
jgi:hypothetical protein